MSPSNPPVSTSPIDSLGKRLGQTWAAIQKAQVKSLDVQKKIRNALTHPAPIFSSSDLSLVVFGSIARLECTEGSDVDWTLLIDGQVDPKHNATSLEIKRAIDKVLKKLKLKEPATGGAFGGKAFSHDIIHHIGGDRDSNRNMTQRILLLLESAPVRLRSNQDSKGDEAYDRVLKAILQKYLQADSGFFAKGKESHVPRFLLNDIVRFWRTMCVDFAWKGWEQGEVKWALRNIKLRFSRKLIFFSGLLLVFSCYKNKTLAFRERDERINACLGHLESLVRMKPLDIVCSVLLDYNHTSDRKVAEILNRYDRFLSILNKESERKRFEGMGPQKAYKDRTFQRIRKQSHEFQDVISEISFSDRSKLGRFIRQYGVF